MTFPTPTQPLQEPWGDDHDFFADDGTGFMETPEGTELPYWTLDTEYMQPTEGDVDMTTVNTVVEGTRKAFILEPKDEAGNPLDGTNEVFTYTLSERADDPQSILVKTLGNGITMLVAYPLKLRVELFEVDTKGLDGLYHQEVRMTILGAAKSIMKSILKVIPSTAGAA